MYLSDDQLQVVQISDGTENQDYVDLNFSELNATILILSFKVT